MTSTRHFILSFFGPVVVGGLFCVIVSLNWKWLEDRHLQPMLVLLLGTLATGSATRWFMRNCVAVRCPFCGGKSYEIPDRGNRFMCLDCGKDH